MREPGFYWVMNHSEDGWEIGQMLPSGLWILTGSGSTYTEDEMILINELPIMSHTARVVDGFEEKYI